MQSYRTTLRATKDGLATFGLAFVCRNGLWKQIGETRRFKAYPAAVRARAEARGICKRHAKHNDTTAEIQEI